MKRLLALLLFAVPCFGQVNPTIINSAFNTATAATPTFSPASPYTGGTTTVTASSTTIGQTGCTMYFDANASPTTAQTTYSFTTSITLYAQVRGCAAYNNSAIATWVGTFSYSYNPLHIYTPAVQTGSTPYVLSITSTTAGNSLQVWAFCTSHATTFTDSHSDTFTTPASLNYIGTGYSQAVSTGLLANIASGITSITFTPAGYDNCYFVAVEAQYVVTSPVTPDVTGTQSETAYGTGPGTTTAVTTTNNPDVLFGIAMGQNSQTVTSSDCTTIETGGAAFLTFYLGYKNVTTAGSYSCTVSWTVASKLDTNSFALKVQ